MYFKLRAAFQEHGTMRNIHDGVTQNNNAFKDVSVLGNFLDNHDNPRFLSKNSDQITLKNALAYLIFAEGIPIIYYGTEQGYSGDNDPRNRESLWPSYNTDSDLYKFISQLATFRNKQGTTLWESKQIERYVDDNFFAFTRDKVFVATTNSGDSFSVPITYHPYSDGTVLHNLLDSSDSVTVSGGRFTVNMSGPPKVYVPDHIMDSPDQAVKGSDLVVGTKGIIIAGVAVGLIFVTVPAIVLLAYAVRRRGQYHVLVASQSDHMIQDSG